MTKALKLSVLLEGKEVGTLIETESGLVNFSYNIIPDSSTPISTSMPIRNEKYISLTVAPFIEGLLPDNERDLREIKRKYKATTPARMLEHIGLDVAGALQFCLPEDTLIALTRKRKLTELSRIEIGEIIAKLNIGGDRTPPIGVPMSLAGNQAKTALQKSENGKWYWPDGAEPSTHIIKPGIPNLKSQAAIEYISMKLASKINISAAPVTFEDFDGNTAIVIERYDRFVNSGGQVERIHQEDFCQALSVYPENKYIKDGGPSPLEIIEHIKKFSQADILTSNIDRFTDGLFYNYLIGAPDGHAKNYSLLLSENDVILAPLYDVASGVTYNTIQSTRRWETTAMPIGGESRFGKVKTSNIVKFAKDSQQDEDKLVHRFKELSKMIPDALSTLLDDTDLEVIKQDRAKLLDGIAEICKSFK